MSRLATHAAPIAWCPALSASTTTETNESNPAVSGGFGIRVHPTVDADGAPFIRVREISRAETEPAHAPDCVLEHDEYRIKLVRTGEQRRLASKLIARMYASRGYDAEVPSTVAHSDDSVTFGAYNARRFCGTLTLGFDFGHGLLADTLYRAEIDAFRGKGSRVCELSRFAIDPDYSSKGLLASLFQAACMHALDLGMDVAVIEVNPRHTAFYRRILGFRQSGEVRTCPRVNAPAALLHVEVRYVADQIRHYASSAVAVAQSPGGAPSGREDARIAA